MNTKLSIVLLMLFQFMTTMSMSIVLSLAPALASFFNIETAMVPYLNIGFVISGMLVPIFGYYADKLGIKKMMVLGAFIFSLGMLLTAFATHPIVYFITRMIIGIGHNVFFALVAAYSSRLVDEKLYVKLSGYFKLAFASGLFAAPLVGALVVNYFSFQTYYLVAFVISFTLAILLLRIPHVTNVSTIPISFQDFKDLFKVSYVPWFMLTTFLIFLAPNTIYNFLSIYLNELGQSQQQISFIYTISGIGAILSGFVILFLGHRYSLRDLLRYGVMGVIVTLLFVIPLNTWLILPAMLAFALALDLVVGVLYPVASKLPVKNPASLTASLSLTMSVTALGASLMNPILYAQFGFRFLVGMVLVAVVLGYFSLIRSLHLVQLDEK